MILKFYSAKKTRAFKQASIPLTLLPVLLLAFPVAAFADSEITIQYIGLSFLERARWLPTLLIGVFLFIGIALMGHGIYSLGRMKKDNTIVKKVVLTEIIAGFFLVILLTTIFITGNILYGNTDKTHEMMNKMVSPANNIETCLETKKKCSDY